MNTGEKSVTGGPNNKEGGKDLSKFKVYSDTVTKIRVLMFCLGLFSVFIWIVVLKTSWAARHGLIIPATQEAEARVRNLVRVMSK